MKYYNFKEVIEQNIAEDKISIIAESKKASPSAGVIIENYDPVQIAKIYQKNKATCLSILTEEDFFLGNLSHIYKIKLNSNAMENTGINLPIIQFNPIDNVQDSFDLVTSTFSEESN